VAYFKALYANLLHGAENPGFFSFVGTWQKIKGIKISEEQQITHFT
jgi:hypothetical protein